MLDQLLSDIGELVRCESPSSDLEAVARSADVVTRVGTKRLGVAPERIVRDGCSHLVWRLGDGPTRVLLLGHHDTVWPSGTLMRRPYSVVDGVMTGPGCLDMKAGLGMAFHATAQMSDAAGVAILVTGDEELGSPTSRSLIEEVAYGCEAVLVLEASGDGGALKTERKGVSLYRLLVHGRAAHAGLNPGLNATVEIAHQVLAVRALGRGETTVTPTLLSAGTTANTVPAYAELAVDVRVPTWHEQERVEAEIRGLRSVTGAGLEVEGGPNRPPLESASSDALFARATARPEGRHLTRTSVGGASDGNFTAGLGVPTLDGLGAVGGGAHADDEHVVVADLEPRTRLLTALLGDLVAPYAGTIASAPARGGRP